MLPSSYQSSALIQRASYGNPTCSGALPPLSSLAPDDLRGRVMAAARVSEAAIVAIAWNSRIRSNNGGVSRGWRAKMLVDRGCGGFVTLAVSYRAALDSRMMMSGCKAGNPCFLCKLASLFPDGHH